MAIFGKDPDATSRARSTLRNLAHLEPEIVMPQFLERAYTGLETVNEVRDLFVNHSTAHLFNRPIEPPLCLPPWLKSPSH
jgi:hypothetical protein